MAIQAGFEQAVRGLGLLRKSAGFDKLEIERFSDLTAEARAVTLSYLFNVIEGAETDESARLQSRRLKRERPEQI